MSQEKDNKIKEIKEFLSNSFDGVVIETSDKEPPYTVFYWEHEDQTYILKFHPDPFKASNADEIKKILNELNAINQLKTNGRTQMIKAEPKSDKSLEYVNTIRPCV